MQQRVREGDQNEGVESPPMSELPMDILETQILLRLPIDVLPKFKSVCKYFNSLISTPEFMDEHLRRSGLTGHLVVLNINGRGFHVFEFDGLESMPFFLPFPFPFPAKTFAPKVHVFGSCNGLLCVGLTVDELMLLNPFTGMFFKIPPLILLPEAYQCNIGFGFDDLTNDYKIVRIMAIHEETWEVGVYSLRENSWKIVESSTTSYRSIELQKSDNGVMVNNHLLHWVFTYNHHTRGGQNYRTGLIGCFDLRTGQWVDNVALPCEFDDEHIQKHFRYEALGVFEGCLCLLTPSYLVEPTQVDVWVMKEYGEPDSWVKVLGGSDSCVTSTWQMCLLGSSHGEILLVRGEKHTIPGFERVVIIWYNVKDKTSRLSQIHKVHGVAHHFYDVCISAKTLVRLPGDSFVRKVKLPLPENTLLCTHNSVMPY